MRFARPESLSNVLSPFFRDPHWYTRRVKELSTEGFTRPDNINRDNGIEIPEALIPTIKKHNRRAVRQRTTRETTSHRNNQDRNAPITANHRDLDGDVQPVDLIKTSSKQSKCRDLQLK